MPAAYRTPIQNKPYLKWRILATLLDYTIYYLLFAAYIYLGGDPEENGTYAVHGLMALPVVLLWLLYFVLLESYYGATPGHLLFKLRVVTLRGHDIGVSHALRRHLLDSVDVCLWGIPAIICIKNSLHHQRIGDMWAGTVVVREQDLQPKNALV